MKPSLRHVGAGQHPVLLVTEATGRAAELVDMAAAMTPFPPVLDNMYPGLRRPFGKADAAANAYVDGLLHAVAAMIGGAFSADVFDLIEASFSLVTTPPGLLAPQQRMPHFDSTDPNYIAVLHYLSGVAGSGTAFFRHRATSVELVDEAQAPGFVAAVRRESASMQGYIAGSNDRFEEIGRIDAAPDLLAAYQGGLLHSGIIGPDLSLSADPRCGRLTANMFIRIRRTA